MVILRDSNKTALNENNNNLTKAIESEAQLKTFKALSDIVSRNNKMQPYVDAGGRPLCF